MQIIPAILEMNFNEAESKIKRITDLAKWVQIDVIDNVFAEGKTFELELLNKIEPQYIENLLIDIHLMVKEPDRWIEKCEFVQATRITGQVERMENRENFVRRIKDDGAEAGLAFDIETAINEIPEETDVVLLLGRKAGFGQMEMDERIWERLEKLHQIRNDGKHFFKIGIDGGVTEENIGKLEGYGVDLAYTTGAIFSGNANDNWERLQSKINKE